MSKYVKSVSLRLTKDQNKKLSKISRKFGKSSSNALRHLIDIYEDDEIFSEYIPEKKENKSKTEKVNLLNNPDKLELLRKFKIAKLNGIKDRK